MHKVRAPVDLQKCAKTYQNEWFGAFSGDPFVGTNLSEERSHAAWRSFCIFAERSRTCFLRSRTCLDSVGLIWWVWAGPSGSGLSGSCLSRPGVLDPLCLDAVNPEDGAFGFEAPQVLSMCLDLTGSSC